MVFLALEEDLPGTDAGAFAPHLEAEAVRVWTLQQQGVLRQIWFRQDRSAAVLLLECPDRRTAEEALDRINEQVGDMSAFVEEAEDMFEPLEE